MGKGYKDKKSASLLISASTEESQQEKISPQECLKGKK